MLVPFSEQLEACEVREPGVEEDGVFIRVRPEKSKEAYSFKLPRPAVLLPSPSAGTAGSNAVIVPFWWALQEACALQESFALTTNVVSAAWPSTMTSVGKRANEPMKKMARTSKLLLEVPCLTNMDPLEAGQSVCAGLPGRAAPCPLADRPE